MSRRWTGADAPEIAILGAGLSGMCMGIQLRRAGFDRFSIYEKADRVGGTWRDNAYPGVACDVPSHLYSYSFAINSQWSRVFSPGAEIQEYCEKVAREYGLEPYLRLGEEVLRVDHDGVRWRVQLRSGEERGADVVISALGGLHEPNVPHLPGIERFRGARFHSAQWDAGCDLRGRRVALIGSAASAIQIAPEIAESTERLHVFQRTPNWILPRFDRAYSDRWRRAFGRFPALVRLYRWAIYWALEVRFPLFVKGRRAKGRGRRRRIEGLWRRYLESKISDPELRRKLTPDYELGCKRVLISDDFYDTLAREDVELVTDPIDHLEEDAIVTCDGARREVDVLVYATGFRPFDVLSAVQFTGPGGRSLAEVWKDGLRAHRTLAVPGFPNLFFLLGPNSGLAHNSVILMIESQVNYVVKCLRAMADRALRSLAPRAEVAARYDARIERDLERTVWSSGGCKSWYQDPRGRVFALWPHSTLRYFWEMRRLRLDEYEQEARSAPGAPSKTR